MKKFVVKRVLLSIVILFFRLHDHLRDHALHAVVIHEAAGTDIVSQRPGAKV